VTTHADCQHPPINKIGFFHYDAVDKWEPVESLESSIYARLSKSGENYLNDSLIVLPEAFNFRGEYTPRCGYQIESSVATKHRLKTLAKQFGIVFVVGLIDNDEPRQPLPPLSSAYLITSTCCHRLCRKTGSDNLATADMLPVGDRGDNLYRRCELMCNTPILYDDHTCIAALLCMDATARPGPQTDNSKQHNALRAKVCISHRKTILCVPARMRQFPTLGVADEWHDVDFVLANACHYSDSVGRPSVIRIDGFTLTFPENAGLQGNTTCLTVQSMKTAPA
jgi:hypothetical protein